MVNVNNHDVESRAVVVEMVFQPPNSHRFGKRPLKSTWAVIRSVMSITTVKTIERYPKHE